MANMANAAGDGQRWGLVALLVLLWLATAIASTSLKAGAGILTIATMPASGRGRRPLDGGRIRYVFNHMGGLGLWLIVCLRTSHWRGMLPQTSPSRTLGERCLCLSRTI
jgi:hypothetical protein